MEMSPELLFVIGLVASALVWLVKFIQSRWGSISSGWLTGGVYVVAGLLAFAFAPMVLPAFPAFVDLASFIPALLVWIGELLIPLSAFAGFATLIYNALLKRILEGVATRFQK